MNSNHQHDVEGDGECSADGGWRQQQQRRRQQQQEEEQEQQGWGPLPSYQVFLQHSAVSGAPPSLFPHHHQQQQQQQIQTPPPPPSPAHNTPFPWLNAAPNLPPPPPLPPPPQNQYPPHHHHHRPDLQQESIFPWHSHMQQLLNIFLQKQHQQQQQQQQQQLGKVLPPEEEADMFSWRGDTMMPQSSRWPEDGAAAAPPPCPRDFGDGVVDGVDRKQTSDRRRRRRLAKRARPVEQSSVHNNSSSSSSNISNSISDKALLASGEHVDSNTSASERTAMELQLVQRRREEKGNGSGEMAPLYVQEILRQLMPLRLSSSQHEEGGIDGTEEEEEAGDAGKQRLNLEFIVNPNPSFKRLRHLSDSLGKPIAQIRAFFFHRRSRSRQMLVSMGQAVPRVLQRQTHCFSEEQTEVLERALQDEPYPSDARLMQLATFLGERQEEVKKWMQRHRCKKGLTHPLRKRRGGRGKSTGRRSMSDVLHDEEMQEEAEKEHRKQQHTSNCGSAGDRRGRTDSSPGEEEEEEEERGGTVPAQKRSKK